MTRVAHPIEALDPQFKADAQTVADLTGPDADVERIEGLVLDRRATQEGPDFLPSLKEGGSTPA